MLASLAIVVPVAGEEVLAAGRKGHVDHAVAIYGIVEGEAFLEVVPREQGGTLVALVGHHLALEGRSHLVVLVGEQLEGNLIVALGLQAQGDVLGGFHVEAVVGILLPGFRSAIDIGLPAYGRGHLQLALHEAVGTDLCAHHIDEYKSYC